MASQLISNIGQLISNDPNLGDQSELGISLNSALIIEGGRIAWIGDNESAPSADSKIDAEGCAVIPGFVDSHSHAIFAGDRLNDFTARMAGKKYATGGIATTISATRDASDGELRNNLSKIVREFKASGITTYEVKSGYGLDTDTEVRLLKIAREFTTETTFLGAHVIPAEYANDRAGYVKLVAGSALDACAPYAKWIDVFCDKGAFTKEEARIILEAGIAKGLQPRLHGNQFGDSGGIELAVELNCASVDHCTYTTDSQLQLLANSSTVATLLPGAEFSTRSPYPDARRFYKAGVSVALATDCNPGTSFISSMPWIIATAVREMFFSPAQALYAATRGGARALRRSDIGNLAIGSRADIVILNAPRYEFLAYRPGATLISLVIQS